MDQEDIPEPQAPAEGTAPSSPVGRPPAVPTGPPGQAPGSRAPPGAVPAGWTQEQWQSKRDKDGRTLAMLAHLSLLAVLVVSLLSFLGPLLIWLLAKEDQPFVVDQGKEALNFQITYFIVIALASAVMVLSTILTLGIGLIVTLPLLVVLSVGGLVYGVVGAVKANDGVAYRYPVCIRFFS